MAVFVNISVYLTLCVLSDGCGEQLGIHGKEGSLLSFPTMDNFLELHEGTAYEMLTRILLRKVVGEKVWSGNCYRALLSEYCTASDEAFALLAIENNYERWKWMHENQDCSNTTKGAPETLYTNASADATPTAGTRGAAPSRFQGWSVEGYKRFDAFHKLVKADRAQIGRTKFEEDMKNYFAIEMASTIKRRKKKTLEEDEDEGVYPAHDFDDVDMGGIDSDNDNDSQSHADSVMKEQENGDEEEEDEEEDEDENGNEAGSQSDHSTSSQDEVE